MRAGPESLRVAAIQLCCGQNREENLDRACVLMEQAVGQGAQLLALPENLSFLGRDADKLQVAEDLDDGPTVAFLRAFAAKYRVPIVGGTVPLKTGDPGKVTNSCLVFDGTGALVARYDKIHLFDVAVDAANTYRESDHVRAGNNVVTIGLLNHVMALSVCYDLRFPELYRTLALRGAQVLFVPSAFTRVTGEAHWEILLRARAIENLAYVVAPAQWGMHGHGRESYGHTSVVGPWGDVLGLRPTGEGVVLADLDFAVVAAARHRLPSLAHIRLPIGE